MHPSPNQMRQVRKAKPNIGKSLFDNPAEACDSDLTEAKDKLFQDVLKYAKATSLVLVLHSYTRPQPSICLEPRRCWRFRHWCCKFLLCRRSNGTSEVIIFTCRRRSMTTRRPRHRTMSRSGTRTLVFARLLRGWRVTLATWI
jgi:hypothetical protein